MAATSATMTDLTESPGRMRRSGEVQRFVAADAADLYRWVADVTRTPEWSPEVIRTEWIDGAVAAAPGARFRGRSRVGLLRWTRICEVLTAEPGREFRFRTVDETGGQDVTAWGFRFEPVEGGTLVTHSYEIPKPLTGRQEWLTVKLIPHHADRRPDMRQSLDRIAELAEGRRDATQAELGQAHTAAGHLDLNGMFVMHRAFRRDLRDLAAAVLATPVDDAEVWAALDRRWTGFADTLHHHHRAEDLHIWPLLLRQVDAAGDAGARDTLAAMEAEHELIDPLLEHVGAGFRAMAAAPDAAGRDRLTAAVARAADQLGAHLAHEESGALPLAQRYLSKAAWAESEKNIGKEYGTKNLGFVLPWVSLGLSRQELDLVFAQGGAIIRLMLVLTRRRFLREHAVAFRYLPVEPVR